MTWQLNLRSQHALFSFSTRGWKCDADLLKLISDGLGFFVPLKPHHVLCVEPPGLLLQGFGCQILGLSALQRGAESQGEEGGEYELVRTHGICRSRVLISRHSSRRLPPGSKRWRRVFLWKASGKTLQCRRVAVAPGGGKAGWGTGSSSGTACKSHTEGAVSGRQIWIHTHWVQVQVNNDVN